MSSVVRVLYIDIYNRTNTVMQLKDMNLRGGQLRTRPQDVLQPGQMTKVTILDQNGSLPSVYISYATANPSYSPNLVIDARFQGPSIDTRCARGFRVDESHHKTGTMYRQEVHCGVSLYKA